MRARSHGRDIRGFQNKKSRRCSARSHRRNKHSHRHRRIQNVVNDVLHGGREASGSIHGDENETGVNSRGFGNSTDDILGHHRLDFFTDAEFHNLRGRIGLRGSRRRSLRTSRPPAE